MNRVLNVEVQSLDHDGLELNPHTSRWIVEVTVTDNSWLAKTYEGSNDINRDINRRWREINGRLEANNGFLDEDVLFRYQSRVMARSELEAKGMAKEIAKKHGYDPDAERESYSVCVWVRRDWFHVRMRGERRTSA